MDRKFGKRNNILYVDTGFFGTFADNYPRGNWEFSKERAKNCSYKCKISKDLFQYDGILAVVNWRGVHWGLVFVSLKDKEAIYFDSIRGKYSNLKSLQEFFKEFLLYRWENFDIDNKRNSGSKRGKVDFPFDILTVDDASYVTQQADGYNCGVATLINAHNYISVALMREDNQSLILSDPFFPYKPLELDHLRVRMTFDIMNKELTVPYGQLTANREESMIHTVQKLHPTQLLNVNKICAGTRVLARYTATSSDWYHGYIDTAELKSKKVAIRFDDGTCKSIKFEDDFLVIPCVQEYKVREEVLCFWKSEKAPDSVRRYAVVNTKNKFKGADNPSVWYPAVIVEIEEVTIEETRIKNIK